MVYALWGAECAVIRKCGALKIVARPRIPGKPPVKIKKTTGGDKNAAADTKNALMKKHAILLLLACCAQLSDLYAVGLKNLKVEYASCPLGVDVSRPRFSWQMSAGGERGVKQVAYRLQVYDETGSCVWDSGETQSGVSLNIEYAGKPLEPETRYEWEVCVWTQKNDSVSASSWFETGLMAQNDADEAWDGAQWIGGGDEDMPLYSHYLPVFRLDYAFRFDKASGVLKAAFVYGANDERLMDADKNLFGLANGRDESYVRVEIDAAPLAGGREAEIRIYRAGFCPADRADVPLRTFAVPKNFLNGANLYEGHTLSLTSELGFTRFFFDGKADKIGEVNLNPLGQGGDFIAFPVVGDVGFCREAGKPLAAERLEIRNFRTPCNVLRTVEADGWTGIADPGRNSMPMLRTTFSTEASKVVKARLYVTARGIYDFYINGKRIGDAYFNPGATQYNRTHLYQTFDVTSFIKEGDNAAGAVLSEGWWSGGCTFTGNNWNYFGDRQSLLARLVITYRDGRKQTVVTNPDTWKYFNDGPTVYGSFFQGEVYDARKEAFVSGWSTASYDEGKDWKPAQVVPLEGTVSTTGGGNSPRADDYSRYRLTGQFGPSVYAVKELTAQSVKEVRPGVFVYDMGQNMAGVPRIALKGCMPGQRICLRFAEVKYPDLPRYAGHAGMIMLENIRAAMAQDVYIARGGEETIAPRFTFHGYRFVEITGIDRPLPLESVKGTALSSVNGLLSRYETSNPKVNRLWENIV